MIVAALAAEGTEIAIPLLAKVVIDGAIAHHERGLLLPLGLLAVGLGVASAAQPDPPLGAGQRRGRHGADDQGRPLRAPATARPGVPRRMAVRPAALARDHDLSSIRRFAGFGLVFLISDHDVLGVTGLLIYLNWWLGLITGASSRRCWCSAPFERRYKVLARRVQDQDGDLTTLVEEAATGVRVLKALGRAPEASQAHLAQSTELDKTRVAMAVVDGFWSMLDLVPNAAIAISVVLGAFAISHHSLPSAAWSPSSPSPCCWCGRSRPSATSSPPARRPPPPPSGCWRSSTPSRRSRGIHSAERARVSPPPAALVHVWFTYPGGTAPVLRTSTCAWRAARRWCSPGRPGREDDAAAAGAAAGGRDGRPGAVGGTDVRDIPLAELRPRWAARSRRRRCSPRACGRTSRSARRTPRTTRSRRR